MSLDQFKICSKVETKLKKVVKAFHVFDDYKGLNVLFITSNDKVYGFGQNYWGCCGLGHNSVVKKPQVISELCHKNIKKFFIGFSFVLALTIDGQVFIWGYNTVGQFAIGFCSSEYLKPSVISYFSDFSEHKIVTNLSCGAANTIAITSDGLIYGWGWNIWGQIGIGEKGGDSISTPLLLKIFKNIEIKSFLCQFDRVSAILRETLEGTS